MKIATWNLMQAKPDSSRSRDLLGRLAKIDADVVVLTETWTRLRPQGDYERPAVSTPGRDGNPEECWVAIWGRRGRVCQELQASAEPDRAAAALFAHDGAESVLTVGVVLPWLTDTKREPKGVAAFCAALDLHAREWARLQAANCTTRICVAGDFNHPFVEI